MRMTVEPELDLRIVPHHILLVRMIRMIQQVLMHVAWMTTPARRRVMRHHDDIVTVSAQALKQFGACAVMFFHRLIRNELALDAFPHLADDAMVRDFELLIPMAEQFVRDVALEADGKLALASLMRGLGQ